LNEDLLLNSKQSAFTINTKSNTQTRLGARIGDQWIKNKINSDQRIFRLDVYLSNALFLCSYRRGVYKLTGGVVAHEENKDIQLRMTCYKARCPYWLHSLYTRRLPLLHRVRAFSVRIVISLRPRYQSALAPYCTITYLNVDLAVRGQL
jgi:hypothetical protein